MITQNINTIIGIYFAGIVMSSYMTWAFFHYIWNVNELKNKIIEQNIIIHNLQK